MDHDVLIRLSHVRKEYSNAVPLKDVNTEIRRGEVISVIGPSGTGKSTLIRMINRLEEVTSGQIWIDGDEITAKNANLPAIRKKMGMVFQSFFLFSHMNVIENVMYAPMKLRGLSKQEAYDLAMELLQKVGLQEKKYNWPEELSGGQKQRVAIARTLAMNPEIILLDEPTSALDPLSKSEVISVIKMLAKAGHTMMIVTHEMALARDISTRIFYMDQGGIYEDGTPEEIFEHPAKERTRRFIKQMSVLHYEAGDENFDYHNLVARVEEYGQKQQLDPKHVYRILLMMEELGIVTIIPSLEKPYAVEFVLEYSRLENECNLILRWSGIEQNPIQNINPISGKLYYAYTRNAKYRYDASHTLPNEIRMAIVMD